MKRNRGQRPKSSLAFLVIIPVACLYVFLLTASMAYAHMVYIFAWAEGDTIYTESYFSGNKRVNGGLIRVLDLTGKELLQGKTNEMGEFSFKIPQKTDLRITLEGSMGHGAEYLFKAEEFSDRLESTDREKADNTPVITSPPLADMEVDKVRAMIEEVVDSRLDPILRRLAKLQEESGPGLTEVIGGIGYIFGIMGLIMYLKARKK
jgi:nickel transport protein